MLINKFQRGKQDTILGRCTDQGCFLLSFLTGAVSIVSLKYLGATQLIVTSVPVVIMLAYLALMLIFRRMRVDDDQAGDNLYYLGFLFTLTSLGCALFQYHGASSKESIIQNFGIALTTTIVGLICRVLFGQMRHDPVETEREVRMELTAVAGRLRDQIIETNRILDTTSTAVRQQSAEHLTEYMVRIEELVAVALESSSAHITALSEQTLVMATETAKLVDAVGAVIHRVNGLSGVNLNLDEVRPSNTQDSSHASPRVIEEAIARAIMQFNSNASSAVCKLDFSQGDDLTADDRELALEKRHHRGSRQL